MHITPSSRSPSSSVRPLDRRRRRVDDANDGAEYVLRATSFDPAATPALSRANLGGVSSSCLRWNAASASKVHARAWRRQRMSSSASSSSVRASAAGASLRATSSANRADAWRMSRWMRSGQSFRSS